MILLLLVLVSVPSILSQSIAHFNLEDESKRTLIKEFCDGKSDWVLVDYVNIGKGIRKSSNALRADNSENCISVPILLKPGGTLKLVVYIEPRCEHCGIEIVVNSEKYGIIAKMAYDRASEHFEQGWGILSLNIEKCGFGYINLLGYSEDNKLVLVDSIEYTYNGTSISVNTNKNDSNVDMNNKQRVQVKDFVTKAKHARNERIQEKNLFSTTNSSQGLGLWTILMIALGAVTILALVIVSAYHFGKVAGRADTLPPITLDEELPRVDMIPRVMGTTNFENTLQNYI